MRDLSSFTSAVIDERAFRKLSAVLERAKNEPSWDVVAGAPATTAPARYVSPRSSSRTIGCRHLRDRVLRPDPGSVRLRDGDYDEMLNLVDTTAVYALTGSVFASDRSAIEATMSRCATLRELLHQRQANRSGRRA